MQEIIQSVLNGNANYEKGNLYFSCPKLEISMSAGETKEGSFMIEGEESKLLHGYVTSSDLRMECLVSEFSGNQEEIPFCFHAENLEEGEVVKGEFYVVSNQGESYLPFVVTIVHTKVESSMGPIKNLFHFANLAKMHWDEAVKVFYSDAFKRVLKENDQQYFSAYCGLSKYPGNEQNVEEFLLHINKKQKVEYLLEEKEIQIDHPKGTICKTISVIRNGWGYTHLDVETNGDFLTVEKEQLTDDDFLGDYCRLPFYVQEEKLHAGKNYGQVIFYNSSIRLEVNVTVCLKELDYHGSGNLRKEKKQLICDLINCYEAFRLRKIPAVTWQRETQQAVEKLVAMDEKNVQARLFQAQFLITQEHYNEAEWILKHTKDLITDEAKNQNLLFAYYLYLTTLIRQESGYGYEVMEQIEEIYKRNPYAWQVAWLLMYLSEQYEKSSSKKWIFLEEQYNRGCRSPLIYMEALLLLQNNPTLLGKIDSFEQQILLFAVKKEGFNKNLIEQIVLLSEKEKDFSEPVFQILKNCYELENSEEVLKAICALLIKGNKSENKYFPWYEKAVASDLKLTRLYDYYMFSIDLNSNMMLPKKIIMYFSYYCSLDYEHAAFLYTNIWNYQEKIPELFASYRDKIQIFIAEQILKGHINRHLAFLYKNVLKPETITKEMAESLAQLLFLNIVKVQNINISKIIILQPKFESEQEYSIVNKEAMVSLLGSEYTLLLEDYEQNRYIADASYQMEKLMLPAKMGKQIEKLVETSIAFDLFVCDRNYEREQITEQTKNRYRRLLDSDKIEIGYKKEIGLSLLQYYYDYDYIKELDEYLEKLEPVFLDSDSRGKIIRLMVLRGHFERAYEWIREYGPFYTDAKTLVRICDYMLERTDYVEDSFLLNLVAYVFRKGKYNANMLQYLILYYYGMTKEMRDIWKAACAFEVDTYKLCEKLLLQMTFSGAFIGEWEEIFRSYVQGGAKPEIEIAFLTQCAYDYFVNQKIMNSFVFEEMLRIHKQKEVLSQGCKLAILKYFAENIHKITNQSDTILEGFLNEMLNQGIYLKFFKEYIGIFDCALQLLDKSIIEYYAPKDTKVTLHYAWVTDATLENVYQVKEMKKGFEGVWFQEFVLFFGEKIHYYIVEEENGIEQLTESGMIQINDAIRGIEDHKYSLINALVTSNELQDYDTFNELLEEYCYKNSLCQLLFHLK